MFKSLIFTGMTHTGTWDSESSYIWKFKKKRNTVLANRKCSGPLLILCSLRKNHCVCDIKGVY